MLKCSLINDIAVYSIGLWTVVAIYIFLPQRKSLRYLRVSLQTFIAELINIHKASLLLLYCAWNEGGIGYPLKQTNFNSTFFFQPRLSALRNSISH